MYITCPKYTDKQFTTSHILYPNSDVSQPKNTFFIKITKLLKFSKNSDESSAMNEIGWANCVQTDPFK